MVTAQPGQADAAASDDGSIRRWFETRPWYEPLLADPRGAHISFLALARSREFPSMVEEGSRRVWEITLGTEVPFVLRERGSSGDTPMAPGGWGYGLWFPVSVHFVEDFKDDGHPIVNTDYRVGAALKVARGLRRFPRDRLFFKLQVGHGDEFLLNAIDAHGDGFERIDVTSQYIEAGVSWDHTLGNASGQVILRLSAARTLTYKGNSGYYRPVLRDGTPLTPSTRRVEPAIGLQYSPLGVRGAGLVASLDLRRRTLFDYHKPEPSAGRSRPVVVLHGAGPAAPESARAGHAGVRFQGVLWGKSQRSVPDAARLLAVRNGHSPQGLNRCNARHGPSSAAALRVPQ